MPGGRRTDRISQRDLEVLEFIARQGVVPRKAVAMWAGTARAVTAARERRLREAGFVEVWPGIGNSGRIVVCKRSGLQAVCREELSTPRPSPATLVHSCMAATVAARLERQGKRILSEREILAAERFERKRIYSAELRNKRFHRPDLIVLRHPPEAIEVELSDKSNRRLDDILRGWRRAVAEKRIERVRYLCSPRALRYLERAAERTKTAAAISVEPLDDTCSPGMSIGGGPETGVRTNHAQEAVDHAVPLRIPSTQSLLSAPASGGRDIGDLRLPSNPFP